MASHWAKRAAVGETAPLGPAADRARSEALKLVRQDDIRTELAKAPERMGQVRDLIQRLNNISQASQAAA